MQAFSCCVGQLCRCFGSAVSCKKSLATRFAYALQLLVFAFIAWLLSNLPYWVDNNAWLSKIPVLQTCPEEKCYGAMAVYRITFSLAVFHILLALILIGAKSNKDPRGFIQNGWWGIKFLAIIGIMVAAFFIPNATFIPFAWISLFGAAIFILIQLTLLVDMSHAWADRWMAKYQETESRIYAVLLLGTSILFFLAAIGIAIALYILSTKGEGCSVNTAFITVNLIAVVFCSLMSISPKIHENNPRAGMFQSSMVSAYSMYLVYSAIMSEPRDMGCAPFNFTEGAGSDLSIFLGVAFTFVAVVYSALRMSSSSVMGEKKDIERAIKDQKKYHESQIDDEKKQLIDEKKEEAEESSEEEQDPEADDEKEATAYNYTFFHLTFAMAAMYLGLVLTNWQTISGAEDAKHIVVDQGMFSVWVKMISSWLVILLYFWTLIAPIVLPDRDWN
jgi:hypothetical protein